MNVLIGVILNIYEDIRPPYLGLLSKNTSDILAVKYEVDKIVNDYSLVCAYLTPLLMIKADAL